MINTRTESDSLGDVEVPVDSLYGAQTQRAINNFPISGKTMPKVFICALLQIKQAAAVVNQNLGLLDSGKSDAIVNACKTLMNDPELISHFPIDVFQTGSGTSSNMNANEVIANLAFRDHGVNLSPNDDVNLGQSSNDVIPTAIQVSASILLIESLLPALRMLVKTIENKAGAVEHIVKTGRTHLMDAMPLTMGQSLRAWSSQIEANIRLLECFLPELMTLGIGGTAVGTGINTHNEFAKRICAQLGKQLDSEFHSASNLFPYLSSQDVSVALSGHLKTTAVSLMKISNDLRWMNSGPLAGLGEIELEALQPGSSIMPGKVNPVIPEATAMVSAQVMGNDVTINIAGQSGNFELNVMLPVVANNLIQSLELLTSAATVLANKAIHGFKVNPESISQALERNPILVTALNPIIGYEKAANIAKLAYQENKPIKEVALAHSGLNEEEVDELLNPKKLTKSEV